MDANPLPNSRLVKDSIQEPSFPANVSPSIPENKQVAALFDWDRGNAVLELEAVAGYKCWHLPHVASLRDAGMELASLLVKLAAVFHRL